MGRSCSVRGCGDKSSTRHRFPNPLKDRKRYDTWLHLCGNSRLFTVDPNRVYSSYRVCHVHFTKDDISSNMFLFRHSVPTRNLPVLEIEQPSNFVSEETMIESSIVTDTTNLLPAASISLLEISDSSNFAAVESINEDNIEISNAIVIDAAIIATKHSNESVEHLTSEQISAQIVCDNVKNSKELENNLLATEKSFQSKYNKLLEENETNKRNYEKLTEINADQASTISEQNRTILEMRIEIEGLKMYIKRAQTHYWRMKNKCKK